jgi:hypothetical protein
MFIQIYNVSSFSPPVLSIDISAPDCNGKLSRWRVFGLKKNPRIDCGFTLGLQLDSQGEKPAKDKKIQGLTLDLDVFALDPGQSAFFCAHLQHSRLSVCRSVYQNPTFFIFEPQLGQAISLCCVPQLIQ